ncbi:probable centrosomal protein of 41 kDa [Coccomyxa sp. Obi]|nr:probable centrosomal protein of 41 kDa [Coccomyxa sp. Obi]
MPSWTKPLAANVKEKKLPVPNERFRSIKSVVDSGFNELKLKQSLADQRINARFQRGENFSRIKASRMVELLEGEGSDIECLILDLRDEDEYAQYHIKTARKYPARLLSRAVNPLSPEILDFMNAEQRIILLCDWDERIAVPAANLLFEKGADNVVLLSGGLREVLAKCPEVVEGTIPMPASRSRAPSEAFTSTSFSSSAGTFRRSLSLARRQSLRPPGTCATSLSFAPPSGSRRTSFSTACAAPLERAAVTPCISNTPTAAAGPWR